MRSQPQPAKKSYFFGQGYTDIGLAIKTSWNKNANTARKYYHGYLTKGLMSFGGIFDLFCAISVVTFGTLFFALISAVTVLFVSLFFVLVYIGFSVVWLIDRVYLIRRKIFTACNECKSKFLIPTYICPNCGARHSNLTPGMYGILRRRCNCGNILPTTAMGGRKKLEAICPECLKEGKLTILKDRESRPLCIPVVGGRSVGKTAYITAFSKTFVRDIAPACGIDVEFYNDAKSRIYREIENDFASGSTRMTVRPQDKTQASSVSFSFFAGHKTLHPERLVHIYDIAGEVFTDNNENEVQKQYEYCHGIVFIIDPFSIPSVKARYGGELDARDEAGIGKADVHGIIDVFINKLQEVTGLSDRKMSRVPMAVVIGKVDSADLIKEFSQDKIAELRRQYPNANLDNNDATDILCRRFLRENGMEGFLNVIDMKFARNRYFVASAIGHPRDEGRYSPFGVMDPIEWICGIADKKFGDLWSKHKFTDKPISEAALEAKK